MKKTLVILLVLVFLVPVASVNAEIIYQNNFDGGNHLSDWTHIEGEAPGYHTGQWSISDGVLQYTKDPITPHPGTIKLHAVTLPESYIVEFDARTIVRGPGGSTVASYTHWSDWDNFVGHGFRPGRFFITERVDGSWAPTYDNVFLLFPDADPYQWHHFKYIEYGTNCSLYFDGQLVYTYELPILLTGGHLVLWANPGIHQFDNVLITTGPSLEERVEALESLLQQLRDCPTTKKCIPDE